MAAVPMTKMLYKIMSAYELPQEILSAGATRTHAAAKTMSDSGLVSD